jgi:malate dehydrogenase (oxaloacetate-decarboxylating)(NADP+)
MTLLAAEEVRRFGLTPVAALLSHSSFGSSDAPEAEVMRQARALLLEHDPNLAVEGEMQGDAALSRPVLEGIFPGCRLTTEANLLIMPGVDAANIAYNLLKVAAGHGITIGPILLGAAKPVHILEPGVTVRRIVNMTALASVDASVVR